jgi:hypothetical protein
MRRDGADVAAEQARLLQLIPDDAAEDDLRWAKTLIASLAKTVEQQIEALTTARRKIWEIADRADRDEAPDIRAMTRSMEHVEDGLRNPLGPEDDQPGQDS